jgi:hypothetical protein
MEFNTMEVKHILVVLYVVVCVFMLANYLNRPLNKDKKRG